MKSNPMKIIYINSNILRPWGGLTWPKWGYIEGRFSDTSEYHAWLSASVTTETEVGYGQNTTGYHGKVVYCELPSGKFVREINTSYIDANRFLSEGRVTVVSSVSNEAIIKKQDNPQFLQYKVSENIRCLGLYERYCICSTKIVDLVTGYETNTKYSNKIILLGEKEYI